MDKQEYREIVGDIRRAYDRKEYDKVLMYADELELRRVSDSRVLEMISDAYYAGGDLRTARELLLRAYEKTPMGRKMAYKLSELCIEMGDLDGAVEFYEDFTKMSPNDNDRYLLKYKIGKAGRVGKKDLAKVLAAYCSKEVDEKWMAELAELYDEIGEKDRCNEVCDDIILWFADGVYVRKALEMKQKNGELTPSQENKLANLIAAEEERRAREAQKANMEERELRPGNIEDDTLSDEDLDSILEEFITIEDATAPPEPVSAEDMAEVLPKTENADTFEPVSEVPAFDVPEKEEVKVPENLAEENETEVIPVDMIRDASITAEEEQAELEAAKREAKKEAAVEAAIREMDLESKAQEEELFSDSFLEELDLETAPVHAEVREDIIEKIEQPEPEEVPDLLSRPDNSIQVEELQLDETDEYEQEYAEEETEENDDEQLFRAVSTNGRPFSNIEAMQSARTAPPRDDVNFWKMPDALSLEDEAEEEEFPEPVYGSHRWFEEKTEPEFEEPVFGSHRFIPEPVVEGYDEQYDNNVEIEQVDPETLTIESPEEQAAPEGHIPTIRTTSSGVELLGIYAAAKKAGTADNLSDQAVYVKKPALGGKKISVPELFADSIEEPEYYEGPQYFEEEEAGFGPVVHEKDAGDELDAMDEQLDSFGDMQKDPSEPTDFEKTVFELEHEHRAEDHASEEDPYMAAPEKTFTEGSGAESFGTDASSGDTVFVVPTPAAPAGETEPEAEPEPEPKAEEKRPLPFMISVQPHETIEEVVPDIVKERIEAEKTAAAEKKAAEEKALVDEDEPIPDFEELLAEFDKTMFDSEEPKEENITEEFEKPGFDFEQELPDEEEPLDELEMMEEQLDSFGEMQTDPEEPTEFEETISEFELEHLKEENEPEEDPFVIVPETGSESEAEAEPEPEAEPEEEPMPVPVPVIVPEAETEPEPEFVPEPEEAEEEEFPEPEAEPESEPSVFIPLSQLSGEVDTHKLVTPITEKSIAVAEASAAEEVPEEAQDAGFERAVQEFEMTSGSEAASWDSDYEPAAPEVEEAPIIEITASIPPVEEDIEEEPVTEEIWYPDVPERVFEEEVPDEIDEMEEITDAPEEVQTAPEELTDFEKALFAFEQENKKEENEPEEDLYMNETAEAEPEPEIEPEPEMAPESDLSDFEKAVRAFDAAGVSEEDDFDLSELDPEFGQEEESEEVWEEPEFGVPDFSEPTVEKPAFLGDDFTIPAAAGVAQAAGQLEEADFYSGEEANEKAGYQIPDDLREELSEFLLIGGMEERICQAVGNIIERKRKGDPTGGHMIVTGDAKSGKTYLTISIIKAVGKEVGSSAGRVAKVQAEALNGKDMSKVFAKIKGSDLIIENAGYLNDATARSLVDTLKSATGGSMIILEGNRLGIENLLTKNPEIEEVFHTRLDLNELSLSEWADQACAYAEERGYKVGDMALLALHAKIDEINLPTTRVVTEDVQGIIDRAIEKAERRLSGRFPFGGRKGREGERELDETDFM